MAHEIIPVSVIDQLSAPGREMFDYYQSKIAEVFQIPSYLIDRPDLQARWHALQMERTAYLRHCMAQIILSIPARAVIREKMEP